MNKDSFFKSLLLVFCILIFSSIYASKSNENYHYIDFSADFDTGNVINYKNSNNNIMFPTNLNGGGIDADELLKLENSNEHKGSLKSRKIKNVNRKIYKEEEDLLEKIKINTNNNNEGIVTKSIIYSVIILSIFALCIFL